VSDGGRRHEEGGEEGLFYDVCVVVVVGFQNERELHIEVEGGCDTTLCGCREQVCAETEKIMHR
jgi:hypothetical protein